MSINRKFSLVAMVCVVGFASPAVSPAYGQSLGFCYYFKKETPLGAKKDGWPCHKVEFISIFTPPKGYPSSPPGYNSLGSLGYNITYAECLRRFNSVMRPGGFGYFCRVCCIAYANGALVHKIGM